MKKRIIIITSIGLIFIAITTSIIVFINNINNEKRDTNEKINNINASYNNLKNNIISFNETRNDIINILNNFVYEEVPNNIEKYNKTYENYDTIISNIKDNALVLDKNCIKLFKESSINSKCNNYKTTYENVINIFINDITKYNDYINAYNIDTKTLKNYQKILNFKSKVINNYIDYDQDGKYLGKEDNN